MRTNYRFQFALLATICLVFNMTGTALFRDVVFLNQGRLISAGYVMLAGFVLMFLFYISAIVWSLSEMSRRREDTRGSVLVLSLAIVCVFLFMGEKVMIDEIAREYRLGWEVLGEWIILYVCYTAQLASHAIILWNLWHRQRIRESPPVQAAT